MPVWVALMHGAKPGLPIWACKLLTKGLLPLIPEDHLETVMLVSPAKRPGLTNLACHLMALYCVVKLFIIIYPVFLKCVFVLSASE